MKSSGFKKILVGLLFVYFVYCIYYLFVNRQQYQRDFEMQYYSALVFSEGGNPYDFETLRSEQAHTLGYWYAYPPATLWFYRPFALTDYNTAYSIFLFLKAGMIIGLVVLWRMKFVGKQAGEGFYFFCLLAFNSAIFLDMRAGNINMFEQLMLWAGFYFFLERRFLLFGCFILLGASFKLTPIVFLGLLLLTDEKKKYFYFFGSCAIFISYLLIQYAVAPEMFVAFLGGVKWTLVERGVVSPSTINILKDVFEMLAHTTGIPVPEGFQVGFFYIIAGVIILVSLRAYFVLKSLRTEDKEKMILFLACIVYALIHPRLKDYACVLLIVPSYFIINRMRYLKAYPFLFFLAIVSAANVTLPGLKTIYIFMWTYYPLVTAFFIWSLYLYEIYASRKPGEDRMTPTISAGLTD